MIDFKNTKLLGHRGARTEALENTLFGFRHANRLQSKGLAGVEFDVQLTADGHLIVFHDETLERLCGLQARVDQLTLREIQRHTQSGHHIITLDMLAQSLPSSLSEPYAKPQRQALDRLLGHTNQRLPDNVTSSTFNLLEPDQIYQADKKGHTSSEQPNSLTALAMEAHTLTRFTHIELEIKTHERTYYPKLIQALTHYLLDSALSMLPIVLTSFDRQLLTRLQQHQRLASIPRGLLIREYSLLTYAPNTALKLGCTQLGIYYPLLDEQIIQYCHRYQLPVSAWTVNDIESIKQLVKWQVDVIITDIPSQLL